MWRRWRRSRRSWPRFIRLFAGAKRGGQYSPACGGKRREAENVVRSWSPMGGVRRKALHTPIGVSGFAHRAAFPHCMGEYLPPLRPLACAFGSGHRLRIRLWLEALGRRVRRDLLLRPRPAFLVGGLGGLLAGRRVLEGLAGLG